MVQYVWNTCIIQTTCPLLSRDFIICSFHYLVLIIIIVMCIIGVQYETCIIIFSVCINPLYFVQSFNIVDIKPSNMEELTEVITAAEFHPRDCNQFVYSSSKGTIRLCDMRAAALCDSHAKMFEEAEDPSNRSFFSEIISSISDVKFSNSGTLMISRDYLTVKVWDLRKENLPLETYSVSDDTHRYCYHAVSDDTHRYCYHAVSDDTHRYCYHAVSDDTHRYGYHAVNP